MQTPGQPRSYFAFGGALTPLLIFTGLTALLPRFARAQPALLPVVPGVSIAAAQKGEGVPDGPLETMDVRAFFAGKNHGKPFGPNETVYVVLRAVPSAERSRREIDKASFRYDAATGVLTLLGGLPSVRVKLSPDAGKNDGGRGDLPDTQTLTLDSTRAMGKPHNVEYGPGKKYSLTVVTASSYDLELTGLSAFDGRLFDPSTGQFAVAFRDVDASQARALSRACQIVVGLGGPRERTAVGVAGNLPYPPADHEEQLDVYHYVTKAPLTDLFVVDAVTKKVLVHYVPRTAGKASKENRLQAGQGIAQK